MLKNSKRINEKKVVSYYLDEKMPKINLDFVELQSVAEEDNISELPMSNCFIDEFRHDIESVASFMQLVSFKQLLYKAINAKTANRKLGYAVLLLVLIFVLLVFPAGMIYTGIKYLHSCPIQPMLPIWLITIAGVVFANGLFNFTFLSFLSGCVNSNPSTLSSSNLPPPRNRLIELQRFLHLIVLIFHIIWLFIGTIWIMNLRNVFIDNTEKANAMCDKFFFQTVFGHLIVFWVAVALLLSITCFYVAKKLIDLTRQ